MYKRNTVISNALSTFIFTALCLLSIVITAKSQTPPNGNGAPLKGVDVKLGKNPGGSPAARTTDEKGNFDFGVLPKGSYYLTALLPGETKSASGIPVAAKENSPSNSSIKSCLITIDNGTGEPIKAGWDFEKKKAFDPVAQSNQKTKSYNEKTNESSRTGTDGKTIYKETIIVESDGKHPISGAVVKSKSNISNN